MQHRNISGWGNYPKIAAKIYEPDTLEKAATIIESNDRITPRGNGRSYGDAAMGTIILSTLKLNRIIKFNPIEGILTCQGGILLSQILTFIIPKGYFLEVTSGTKLITIGGAIAANVHGKNHHHVGAFSICVKQFTLLDELAMLKICSRTKNVELFWDTFGGMGRTGLIVEATIQLRPISTSFLEKSVLYATNLKSTLSHLENSLHWDYLVAWIDGTAKKQNLGTSIITRAKFINMDKLSPSKQKFPLVLASSRPFPIPFNCPSWLLNTLSLKIFNQLYFWLHQHKTKPTIVGYNSFFYPLDKVRNWNRLYGTKGLVQYQFVVAKSKTYPCLKDILTTLSERKEIPFLITLKVLGSQEKKAKWSFPRAGYTMALDLKRHSKIKTLIKILDKIITKYDGSIYLAKDNYSDSALANFPTTSTAKFTSLQMERLNKMDKQATT